MFSSFQLELSTASDVGLLSGNYFAKFAEFFLYK
jgi:hypothetical protein